MDILIWEVIGSRYYKNAVKIYKWPRNTIYMRAVGTKRKQGNTVVSVPLLIQSSNLPHQAWGGCRGGEKIQNRIPVE